MTEKEYAIAATEVLEILKHFRKQDVEKISPKFIEFLENKKDNTYIPDFDFSNLEITEIPMKKETKAMLAMIYRSYWCSEEERTEYDKILKENSKKKNELIREKYNPDNIFKKENILEEKQINSNSLDEQIKQENLPVDTNNLNLFEKIKMKIKLFIQKIKEKYKK